MVWTYSHQLVWKTTSLKISYQIFFGKLDSLLQLESEAVVTYQERRKVENESSDKGSKMSRKMLFVKSMSDFLKMKKKI